MGPEGPEDLISSSTKKRKRDRGIMLTEEDLGFHTELRRLPVAKNNVEVYVHIRSKIPEKPVKRLNRWLLEKYISNITKAVSKASFNREGDLILRVKGEEEANKLINTRNLGEWPVEIQRHATLNTSKGVVFSTDMCWQNEADIVSALQERCNVKEVYIPKRRKTNANISDKQDEQLIPTGIVIITFGQVEPPTVIPYGFEKLNVRPYIPNPMKCILCQELGHTKNRCVKGYILCRECGHENITGHTCQEKRCVNCHTTGHAANDRNCPTYLAAKEIEKIMVLDKKTRFQAKQHFYKVYNNLDNFMALRGLSTAEILKRAINNNGQTTTIKTKQGAEIHNTPNNQESPRAKKVIETKQPTPSDEDNNYEAVTVPEEATPPKDKQVNNTIKNRFKLLRFKPIEGGITYYIKTSFKKGRTPYLDLMNFKGKGTKYAHELNYLKQVFDKQEIMKTILVTIAKNPNHQILEFTNQNEEIYLKTSSAMDMESSEESEGTECSMEVNVAED